MSFSSSLSGLSANQQKLDVIGNNLANINTVAFKASSIQFMDLVSESVGGSSMNPMQIGLGVTTSSISPAFTQGGLESTGVPTHAAIQGAGFFVVDDASRRSYTRAGDFSFDAGGVLVTPDGRPVQGYTVIDPLTGNIVTTGQPANITIPPGVLRGPTPTTLFGTISNLNASALNGATFTTSVQLFDALGTSHVATITYTKTGANGWNYAITVPGEDVSGGTAGTPSQIANGTLGFNASGRLSQVNGAAAADVTITSPTWANGAAPTNFVWDLIDANNVATVTQFSAPSATASITQNGFAASAIESVTINAGGEVVASFGTGRSRSIGQLALATFNNPQGLSKLGSNRFGETEASGLPSVGAAGSGGRGSVVGGALEQSNVDIATEFTQMILAQRGYQANAKSITVADEVLLETLNIKR